VATTTLVFPGAPSVDAAAETAPWRLGAEGRGLDIEIVGVDRRGEPPTAVARRACALVDGPFRVVGVSGGGPDALATAVLGGDRVERLTIISGFPHPQHGLGLLAPVAEADDDAVRAWTRPLLGGVPDELREAYVEAMVAEVRHLRTPWAFDVSTITAPTTIFHAADDDRCPVESARWLASAIPGARYVEWRTGGHDAGFLHLDELYAAI